MTDLLEAEDSPMGPYRARVGTVDKLQGQESDFLLNTGDVYDGEHRSLCVQPKLRAGLVSLDVEGVFSFNIHGNHGPLDGRGSAMESTNPCS